MICGRSKHFDLDQRIRCELICRRAGQRGEVGARVGKLPSSTADVGRWQQRLRDAIWTANQELGAGWPIVNSKTKGIRSSSLGSSGVSKQNTRRGEGVE